jgi:molybdate transport system substrate-binding protein
MFARFAVTLAAATISVPAVASEPGLLHAAGSLRTALTEVAGAFEPSSGQRVQAKYGPSGTLKDEIAGGAHAEVFASANMEHHWRWRRPARAAPSCCSRAIGCAR